MKEQRIQRIFISLLLSFIFLISFSTIKVYALEPSWQPDLQTVLKKFTDIRYTTAMQTTGDINALMFLVEFPDKPRESYVTKEGLQNYIFNDSTDENFLKGTFPLNNVNDFFSRSSYGKLNYTGEVQEWYMAQHERSYYNNKGQELVLEVLNYYDEFINYSEFDANNDNIIDAINIFYSGSPTYFGDTWWAWAFSFTEPYFSQGKFDGLSFHNYLFQPTSFSNSKEFNSVLIHETGHLLGLRDYYGANSIFNSNGGTFTDEVMDNRKGDFGVYSKLILGWIDNPIIITSDTKNLELTPFTETGSAAIVYPYENNLDEFFILETRNFINNNYTYEYENRTENELRIFRVNLIDSNYRNLLGGIKVLESIVIRENLFLEKDRSDYIYEELRNGGSITPYTVPSTYFQTKNTLTNMIVGKYSGVFIENSHLDGNNFIVDIRIEKQPNPSLFKIDNIKYADQSLTLVGNGEFYYINSSNQIYVTDGVNNYAYKLFIPRNNEEQYKNKLMFEAINPLLIEYDSTKSYQLVIPQGTIKTYTGQINDQMIIQIENYNSPKFSNSYSKGFKDQTGVILYETDYFRFNDKVYSIGQEHIDIVNSNGFKTTGLRSLIQTAYNEDGTTSKREIAAYNATDQYLLHRFFVLTDGYVTIMHSSNTNKFIILYYDSNGNELKKVEVTSNGEYFYGIEEFNNKIYFISNIKDNSFCVDLINPIGALSDKEYNTFVKYMVSNISVVSDFYTIENNQFLQIYKNEGSKGDSILIIDDELNIIKETEILNSDDVLYAERLNENQILILSERSIDDKKFLYKNILDNNLNVINSWSIYEFNQDIGYGYISKNIDKNDQGLIMTIKYNPTPAISAWSPYDKTLFLDNNYNIKATYLKRRNSGGIDSEILLANNRLFNSGETSNDFIHKYYFSDEFYINQDYIDNEPPIITIGQYTKLPTNKDIIVNASVNDGELNALTHTFTENGSFEFIATDINGNSSSKIVEITNIDKENPIITGVENGKTYTTGVIVNFNEGSGLLNGKVLNSGQTIYGWGQFTLVVTDEAGNSTEISFELKSTLSLNIESKSSKQNDITWDIVSGVNGYEIYFSIGTSSTFTLLKSQTTNTLFSHINLLANTQYNYKIRTYILNGTTKVYSDFSPIFNVITPPMAPTLKIRTVDATTLQLNWDPVIGATSYELIKDGIAYGSYNEHTLTLNVTGLTLGASYEFNLIAINGERRSVLSNTVSAITVPAAVSNFKISEIRFNGFTLDWDEVVGATQYVVYQGTTAFSTNLILDTVAESTFKTILPLNFNTTYYYRIVPLTSGGMEGNYSNIVSAKTSITSPSDITLSDIKTNSVKLQYSSVSGAAGYEVHFSKGTSLTYTLLKSQTTVTPVVQTGLTANTVYNFKVRAYRMSGTTKVYSAFSEVKSITTPPSTPVLKVVSKNFNTLSLSWTAVPGATQYELYQNSVLIDTLASSVLSKDISGLELGLSYKYTLVALNGELRSASSVEVTGIPIPAAVGNLKFSEIRFNGFSLDWDEVSGADHYDVFQGTSSTAVTTKVGSVTDSNFTTTTLLNFNTSYYYKVVPVTLSGLNGTASMILTGKTAISAPIGVSVTALSGSSTSVTYEVVNGAAGYEVHFSKGTSLTYTLLKAQTTVTPVIQTGLTANTVYNYKVRAYRMAGTVKVYSAFSEVKSITTPPSTPVLKVISMNSDTLSLSWVAVPGATQYELYQNSVLLDTLESNILSKEISGLELGSSYKYSLVALNGELRSSSSVEVTGIPVPAAVGNLKFSEIRFNGLSLDWDEVSGANHYDVFQGTSSTAVTTKVGSVTDSSFTTTTLLNFNTSYYYKVVPVTLSGLNGTASMILTGKTAISAPTGVSVTALSGSSTSVTYEAVNGAAGYEVHFSKGTSLTYTLLKAQTTVTSIVQTGLTANTVYNYKVRAYRMAGTTKVYGAFSEVKSITTPPSTPILKVMSKSSDTLSLSWAAVPGATQYELYQNSVLIDTLASSVLTKDISGLELGLSYKYTLVALNGELRSASSVEVTGIPVPASVDNLMFSEIRFNGFSIDWNEVEGANHYDVFQGTSSTAVTTKVGSVTDSNFTTTTLLNFNTTYYYKVVPVTLSGLNGTASMILTGKTVISAPTGVSVSALSGSSTSVSYEAVNGAVGYEVHYSKGTSLTYTLLKAQTTVTPVVQTGLTSNTVYNYKVRAYRMSGTTKVYSAFSDVKTITTPPSTPVLKVSSKNSSTLTLSWVAVPGATSYEVYKDATLLDTVSSSVLSLDVNSLNVGQSYGFYIVALNGELRSSNSTVVIGVPVPGAISNFKVVETQYNGFSLDWDGVAGADHYDVFQGTTSTTVTTKLASVTESEFKTTTSLNFNTSYYYKVVPVTSSGLNGTVSSILTAKTALTKPINIIGNYISDISIDLKWDAVSGAEGYEISYSKGTSTTYTVLRSVTTLNTTHVNLLPNTTYNYRIRAYRMSGTVKLYSAYSDIITPVLVTYEEINLLEYSDITTLDIHMAADDVSWSTLNNTMEGLVTLGKIPGQIEKGVATSWSYDESTMTWTFNLNPNAVWVNNQGVVQRSVTASDFVYAWNRLVSDYKYKYNPLFRYSAFIESYQAVNTTTLKVKVSEYIPDFLSFITRPVFFPVASENVNTFGAEYGKTNNSVWYNGAYYLSEWNKGVNAKWTKNQKYWDVANVKTPRINIEFYLDSDHTSSLNKFDSGEIDLISLSGQEYANRKEDSRLVLISKNLVNYILINMAYTNNHNGLINLDPSFGNPLMDNLKIRQAIAYHINKENVVNNNINYPSVVANYYIPKNFASFNDVPFETSRGSGYMLNNKELARSLFIEGMTELGYSETDNGLSISFNVYNDPDAIKASEEIVNELNSLFVGYGITVNLDIYSQYDFAVKNMNGLFELAYSAWGMHNLWPMTYLDNFRSNSYNNLVGHNNSYYDELVSPIGKTTAELWNDYIEAEQVLLESAVIVPISQQVFPKLVNSRLKGLSQNVSFIGLYYKWIYLE